MNFTVLAIDQKRKEIELRLKDTHREKAPSNKTPALTKSRNVGVLVFDTSNQLFIRSS